MEKRIRRADYDAHSEEVQEVMGRIPSSVQRYGIIVILCVLVVLGLLSMLIPYPQTVEADFTLTVQPLPAYVVVQSEGRLERLSIGNNQPVRKGDMLGVIGNVAETEDVIALRDRLREWKRNGARMEQLGAVFFQRIPELGNVQGAYSACLLAWNTFLQHINGGLSYETEVGNAIANLSNAITEWEGKYLLISPTDGKVAYLQTLEEGLWMEAGESVMVVVPQGVTQTRGKALVPMESIGGVRTGQRVIVRLSGFAEQEYGFLEGKVTSVSPVPNSEHQYVLDVELPKGLRSSYGKLFPTVRTLKGTASVVTREGNVLQRILNTGL